jgi:hypothetical protein
MTKIYLHGTPRENGNYSGVRVSRIYTPEANANTNYRNTEFIGNFPPEDKKMFVLIWR